MKNELHLDLPPDRFKSLTDLESFVKELARKHNALVNRIYPEVQSVGIAAKPMQSTRRISTLTVVPYQPSLLDKLDLLRQFHIYCHCTYPAPVPHPNPSLWVSFCSTCHMQIIPSNED